MSKNRRVLVVGGSGLLGGMVARGLSASSLSVRGLLREATRAKAQELMERGVESVTGDLKNQSSLAPACAGVDTIVSTATAVLSDQPGDGISSVDRDGQLSLIDAAESAGVRRFVYISFPEQQEDFPLQSAKRTVEARLRESGLDYTVLRPTFFQEIWMSPPLGFGYLEGRVRVFGDGTKPLRWISVADVCEAVVRTVVEELAVRRTVELLGPEALTGKEVVRIFEKIAGREFAAEFVPEEFLAAQQTEVADPRQQSFFALARQIARGYAPEPSADARALFDPQRTVREYAQRVLQVRPT